MATDASAATNRGLSSLPVSTSVTYRPLNVEAYEIRMLRLPLDEPEHGNRPISCELETISLINPGLYTALSYCWGDPKITAPIIVNGAQIQVTVNLRNALLQLKARGTTSVWIDALCINQTDVQERSLQVRNMQQIYSKAAEVLCYIGEASMHSGTIVD